ncbi:uncharacterized protein [Temnothorax longispinosus]|uniref:uncharacterized protein isoform X2 n=1 Tax=Temnothorax longispinosus TaxID=300112 RepID=UPI003A99CDEA
MTIFSCVNESRERVSECVDGDVTSEKDRWRGGGGLGGIGRRRSDRGINAGFTTYNSAVAHRPLDFLLAWHEPRSVPSAFRRTCAELSGCARPYEKTKEILDQIGSPRGQTEKSTRTRKVRASKRTLRKQETNKSETTTVTS